VKRRSGRANDGCDLFGRSWEPTHTPHYGLISTRCEATITHLVVHQCVAAKLSMVVSLRNSLDRYDKGGLIMIARYDRCMRPKIVSSSQSQAIRCACEDGQAGLFSGGEKVRCK
jgi:hypothetical protein